MNNGFEILVNEFQKWYEFNEDLPGHLVCQENT